MLVIKSIIDNEGNYLKTIIMVKQDLIKDEEKEVQQ